MVISWGIMEIEGQVGCMVSLAVAYVNYLSNAIMRGSLHSHRINFY
jgi:hypothetical protein